MLQATVGRVLSFLLFGLLLYNMVGYPVVYLLEDGHTFTGNTHFIEKTASNAILVKVPVSLPYLVNWEDPEAADGKMMHDGEHYQMKTRQLVNDTMYVHYEYDQNARDRYTSLVSRMQDEITGGHPQKDTPSKILKNFLKEFLPIGQRHTFYLLEWPPEHILASDLYHFALSSGILNVASPPPDQA